MFGGGECESGCFGVDVDSCLLIFIVVVGEGSDELIFGAVYWVFLLEERFELVFWFFSCVFLHVDWVLQHFGIVH